MRGTCLITGGAGFIGCALSKLAKHSFERIIAIDSLHPQIHPKPVRPDKLDLTTELVVGDVTTTEAWDELLPNLSVDTVIHLAAETGTGQSLTESTRHANVNVVGTTQMLDAFVRHKQIPRRVVLASSRAVYGEGAWQDAKGIITYPGQRTNEQLKAGRWDFSTLNPLPFEATRTDPRPTSVYGATKLTQEFVLSAWCLSFGVELGLCRLQNVYGPGQSLTNSYTGIVSLFAQMAKAWKSIPLYEDGDIIRDFVFIDDVAEAIIRLATGVIPSMAPYDIGSGIPTTIRELAIIVSGIYDAPLPHVTGQFRNGDVRAAWADIERAKRDLGWQPKWPVKGGIETLCHWIDEQTKRA